MLLFKYLIIIFKPYQLLKSTVQWIAMETILFMGKINIWAWAEEGN